MTATERYVRLAKKCGCPADQITNFVKARLVLQKKQLLASAAARLCDKRCEPCDADYAAGRDVRADCPDCGPTKVGYGGSRGSAKSFWGLGQVGCDDCQRFPGLKFLYLRKVGKSGREAIQDLRRQVFHSTPHLYKSKDNLILFPHNESKIVLGHFRHENDIDTYLGIEYDGVLTEEATQLSHNKIKLIGTCIRSSKPGWRPRHYLTTNPGGIGHSWFKSLFIVPLRNGTEASTRFIQALPSDNKFLNPEYRATLEALTGWMRAAWLHGSWDLMAGQFFTNWRRDLVVKPLGPMPRHWRAWLGFDYGFAHYTSVHLLGQDGDGNVWIIDEHAERGWLPEQHADAIKAMLGRHGIPIGDLDAILAGHDCFSKDHRAKTISDDYEALGLTLTRANLDRINGAAEFLRRLGTPETSPPRLPTLFIDPRCARLIECLPSLQRDLDRPEDVLKVDCDEDGLGGDDTYDSSRYALMYASEQKGRRIANPFDDER